MADGSVIFANFVRFSGGFLPAPNAVVGPHPVFGGLLGARILDRDFTGNGRVAGRVYVIATPAPARRVRLHHRGSGVQVRETFSDSLGYYEFVDVDPSRDYFVTAFDVDTGLNAVIQDRVRPAAVTYPYVPPPAAPGPGAGNYTPSYPLAFDLAGAYSAPSPINLNLV